MANLSTRVQRVLLSIGRRHKSYPAHNVLTMPALSPTMTHGTIAEWVKKEGDSFKAGESIAKVETDKATVDFEVTDDGVLAKILVQAPASDVPCGSVVAILCENVSDVPAFSDYKVEAATVPATAPKASPAPVAAPAPAPVLAPVDIKPAVAPATPSKSLPAPVAAVAPGDEAAYLAWPAWGHSLSKSPLGGAILAKQRAYNDIFGPTGQEME